MIAPELIEKAFARAFVVGAGDLNRKAVVAALECVLPDVVEQCAQVAEKHIPASKRDAIAYTAGQYIAAAIRNIAKETPNENG